MDHLIRKRSISRSRHARTTTHRRLIKLLTLHYDDLPRTRQMRNIIRQLTVKSRRRYCLFFDPISSHVIIRITHNRISIAMETGRRTSFNGRTASATVIQAEAGLSRKRSGSSEGRNLGLAIEPGLREDGGRRGNERGRSSFGERYSGLIRNAVIEFNVRIEYFRLQRAKRKRARRRGRQGGRGRGEGRAWRSPRNWKSLGLTILQDSAKMFSKRGLAGQRDPFADLCSLCVCVCVCVCACVCVCVCVCACANVCTSGVCARRQFIDIGGEHLQRNLNMRN